MSKLFTVVFSRLHELDTFKETTIDCNKILFFREKETGLTTVYFNQYCVDVQMNYYEFQQMVINEILKLEHNTDILQLMAGYLSNNGTGNVLMETLIKDCRNIIKGIASENNKL